MAIAISQAVYDGILAVRDSGATNMLDRPRVIQILDQMGLDEAAEWVRNNKSEYSHGIFQGFSIGEPQSGQAGES